MLYSKFLLLKSVKIFSYGLLAYENILIRKYFTCKWSIDDYLFLYLVQQHLFTPAEKRPSVAISQSFTVLVLTPLGLLLILVSTSIYVRTCFNCMYKAPRVKSLRICARNGCYSALLHSVFLLNFVRYDGMDSTDTLQPNSCFCIIPTSSYCYYAQAHLLM